MKKGQRKSILSPEELKQLVSALLDRSVIEDGERALVRGAVSNIAGTFGVTTRQVSITN